MIDFSIFKKLCWSLGLMLTFLFSARAQFVSGLNQNGELEKGYKQNNAKVACWVYHSPQGKLLRIENYSPEGKKHGYWCSFNQNGSPEKESWYENDSLSGPQVDYFSGFKIREYHIHKNRRHGTYMTFHHNGNPDSAGVYENGKTVGIWLQYYENGKMKSSTSFSEKGEKSGPEKYFDMEGRIIAELNFAKGTLDGKYFQYHKNGGLELEGLYVNGLREGSWYEYDVSGHKIKTRVYKNDIEL